MYRYIVDYMLRHYSNYNITIVENIITIYRDGKIIQVMILKIESNRCEKNYTHVLFNLCHVV